MSAEPEQVHLPVLLAQTLSLLSPQPGDTFVDGTLGAGGHAAAILSAIHPGGRLIGLDRDPEILQLTRHRFSSECDAGTVKLVHANFRQLPTVLQDLEYQGVDGLLLDLGVSSLQLDRAERGFSFQQDGPLDMRMDTESVGPSAADLVASLPEKELADLIFRYGDERKSRRIAAWIVRARRERKLTTTKQLSDLVARAMGRRGKIHPATRTFQALRIAVNEELASLETLLDELPALLNPGGRVVIISFHSLEDRIVKQVFREYAKQGLLSIVNKKPIQAEGEDIRANPRSRSAKLRCATRTTT